MAEDMDMKDNRALRGALLTLLGGTMWGFTGTCGQFLLQSKGLTSNFLVPIRLTPIFSNMWIAAA